MGYEPRVPALAWMPKGEYAWHADLAFGYANPHMKERPGSRLSRSYLTCVNCHRGHLKPRKGKSNAFQGVHDVGDDVRAIFELLCEQKLQCCSLGCGNTALHGTLCRVSAYWERLRR